MNQRMLALFVSTAVAVATSGCDRCKHTGMTITADATTMAGATVVQVHGEGFTPKTMVAVTLQGVPAADRGVRAVTDTTAVTDDVGTFSWSKDVAKLPPLNHTADPNGDVQIIAKEIYVSCKATTTIKAGVLMNQPAR